MDDTSEEVGRNFVDGQKELPAFIEVRLSSSVISPPDMHDLTTTVNQIRSDQCRSDHIRSVQNWPSPLLSFTGVDCRTTYIYPVI